MLRSVPFALLFALLAPAPALAERTGNEPRDACVARAMQESFNPTYSDGERSYRIAEIHRFNQRKLGVNDKDVSASMGKESYGDLSTHVSVYRKTPDGVKVADYLRTDRYFREVFFDRTPQSFAGQTVLDIGCGGGQLVKELREVGVNAYGLDVVIDSHNKAFDYFLQRDATQTGFEANSVDAVISTLSIFSYESKNRPLMEKALREVHRILKPGGKVYLSGGHPREVIDEFTAFRLLEERTEGEGMIILQKVAP